MYLVSRENDGSLASTLRQELLASGANPQEEIIVQLGEVSPYAHTFENVSYDLSYDFTTDEPTNPNEKYSFDLPFDITMNCVDQYSEDGSSSILSRRVRERSGCYRNYILKQVKMDLQRLLRAKG